MLPSESSISVQQVHSFLQDEKPKRRDPTPNIKNIFFIILILLFNPFLQTGNARDWLRITICKNKEDVSVSVFYGIKRDFMQAIPCISANKFRRYVINRDEFANCILCLSAQLIRQNPNYSTKPHHDRHVISSAASPVVCFCCCRPCRGLTHGSITIFPAQSHANEAGSPNGLPPIFCTIRHCTPSEGCRPR